MLKLKRRYYEMHNLLTEEMISITLKKKSSVKTNFASRNNPRKLLQFLTHYDRKNKINKLRA
jgi:hypothetical protein